MEKKVRVLKTIWLIQLIFWMVICSLISYSIFIGNSPNWWILLTTGLIIQLLGLLINLKYGRFNKAWMALILIPLVILALIKSEDNNLISTHIFDGVQTFIMSILIINVLYFLTVVQIIQEIIINRSN